MNRSILLVICDFLLLSVLALVKFDAPEDPPEADQQEEAYAAGVSEDMTELLQMSLEDEAAQRKALEADLAAREASLEETNASLDATQSTLQEREAALAEKEEALEMTAEELAEIRRQREALAQEKERIAAERAALAENFTAAQSEIEARNTALAEQRRQAEQLQSELQARQKALADAQSNLAAAEEQRAALAAEREALSTDLKIVQTERKMLEQNLVSARAEVETARVERQQAEARASELASNVSALAEQSGAIREEIRRQQPINLNEIFSRYETNRLPLTFVAQVDAFIGSREERATLDAILVESANGVYALFESGQSPLRLESLNRVNGVTASFRLGGQRYEIVEANLLRADPRIMSIALPREAVAASGLTPFHLSDDPLRFDEVVLVSNQQGDYGEAPFKLEPGGRGYLSVPDRLLGRVIGNDFGASRGDYVFAKTGDLMGVMVSSDRGAILSDLASRERLPLGTRFSAGQADTLKERYAPTPPVR